MLKVAQVDKPEPGLRGGVDGHRRSNNHGEVPMAYVDRGCRYCPSGCLNCDDPHKETCRYK